MDRVTLSLIHEENTLPTLTVENMEIRRLVLWIAEQFIKARSNKSLEVVAEEYLQELIDRSLILAGKQRANGRMRSCKIHDLLRQQCLSESHTENVVHVMNGNVVNVE
uniref:Disease resistance protein winged helix domain-containing protein n=1 Tax=Solanum lycopersicum TaxID=4081 RepID=A0A3Q7JKQ2_SOLLC